MYNIILYKIILWLYWNIHLNSKYSKVTNQGAWPQNMWISFQKPYVTMTQIKANLNRKFQLKIIWKFKYAYLQSFFLAFKCMF